MAEEKEVTVLEDAGIGQRHVHHCNCFGCGLGRRPHHAEVDTKLLANLSPLWTMALLAQHCTLMSLRYATGDGADCGRSIGDEYGGRNKRLTEERWQGTGVGHTSCI